MGKLFSGTPTIKGVFVNSHIKIVREKKGEAGIRLLEERFGGPLKFRYLQEVPVRDEVRIIEIALDILSETPIVGKERAFEAGRLHFRNFATTALGKLILYSLPRNFKKVMLNTPSIAMHVFRNVHVSAQDTGPRSVKLIMKNNDYPIDHFRGLFHEWMHYWKYNGRIDAVETMPGTYEYTMQWI